MFTTKQVRDTPVTAYLKSRLTGLSAGDLIGYLAVVVFCFFAFNHSDILHTMGCSFAYLNGHFKDFYDYNAPLFVAVNYLPTTYGIFAVLGIPVKILGLLPDPTHWTIEYAQGFLYFWYKLFSALVFFGSAEVLYRIAKKLDIPGRDARHLPLIFLTSPIAIFSQFIFGQYDILTVFFLLLGLLAYLENNLLRFSFWLGVGMTCKYFPVFVFAPLLLVREKRIAQVAKYIAVFATPLLLEVAFYDGSKAFRDGVLGFGAAARAKSAILSIGGTSFNLIFFGFFAACLISYLMESRERDGLRFALPLLFGTVSVALVFACVLWHPQWVLFLCPLIAIAIYLNGSYAKLLLVELIMSLSFFAITVKTFPRNVDAHLWANGIFAGMNPALRDPAKFFEMRSMVPFRSLDIDTWMALFNACLITFVFALGWACLRPSEVRPDWKHLLRFRYYFGLGIFVLPAAFAYWKVLTF